MAFKAGDYIRIVKLGPSSEPYYVTPPWDHYDPESPGQSIPSGYIAEGTLINFLEKGKRLNILRDKRNEVVMLGLFTTSQVKRIIDESELSVVFETENSRYQMTKIGEEKEEKDGKN